VVANWEWAVIKSDMAYIELRLLERLAVVEAELVQLKAKKPWWRFW
jgi:hypothetical protein